jgi:hypothetical protein
MIQLSLTLTDMSSITAQDPQSPDAPAPGSPPSSTPLLAAKPLAIERTAAIWLRFHLGMQVTVREAEDAYYSGYAGRPDCAFEPGMLGRIAALDVPYVRRLRGNSGSFACVDFLHPTIPQSGNDHEWRAGIDPKNLVPLGPPPRQRQANVLFLINADRDSRLSPYMAHDVAILRGLGGTGGGIYGDAELDRLRNRLSEHGYTVEVIPVGD